MRLFPRRYVDTVTAVITGHHLRGVYNFILLSFWLTPALCICLSGCSAEQASSVALSFHPVQKTHSVQDIQEPLIADPSLVASDSREANSIPWRFELIQEDPFIYRKVSDGKLKELPIFLTSIRDCTMQNELTERTAARQLLVGMKEIRVREQKPITLADKSLLRSTITASLDGTALWLISYTLREPQCIEDFVLWGHSSEEENGTENTPPVLELSGFESYLRNVLATDAEKIKSESTN